MTDHQLRYEREQPGPLELDDGTTTPQDFLQMAHDIKLSNMQQGPWRERFHAIKSLALDRLQICLEDCYCPVGCCRLAEWVCEQFCRTGPGNGDPANLHVNESHEPFLIHPPRVIEIQGWINRDELAKLKEKMKIFQQRYEGHRVEICFVGTSKRNLLAADLRERGHEVDADNLQEPE